MSNQLAQQAVQAALRGEWASAKKLNEEILEKETENQEALCRLARAHLELGKTKKALSFYKKVLHLDSYNTIAQKAVERLEKLNENGNHTSHNGSEDLKSAVTFLEEPGKTKTATLIHVGPENLLTTLNVGDPIKLIPHAHRVSVETEDGDFIGRLPDDLSNRIIKFAKAGNEYDSRVRSVTPTQVRVFIKELKRGERVKDIPSFPITDKTSYVAFTPPDLVHEERPSMNSFEEEVAE